MNSMVNLHTFEMKSAPRSMCVWSRVCCVAQFHSSRRCVCTRNRINDSTFMLGYQENSQFPITKFTRRLLYLLDSEEWTLSWTDVWHNLF